MPQRIKPVNNLLIHQFGDEGVILNLNNEKYYRLNGMAIRMWEVLTTTDSIAAAQAQLLDEYDIDAETLKQDMDELIQYLKTANMVETDD